MTAARKSSGRKATSTRSATTGSKATGSKATGGKSTGGKSTGGKATGSKATEGKAKIGEVPAGEAPAPRATTGRGVKVAAAPPRAPKGSAAPVPAPLAPRFHRFALPRTDDGVRHWLFKTEPEVFSFDDLMRAPQRTTYWDGVRNFQVRNFMRDHMRVGDLVLIYHSNAEPPVVAGIACVVRAAYPDHTAFDPQDAHYDPRSDPSAPTWMMVDVQAVRALRPVSLPTLREAPEVATMELLQRGSRLSITPLTPDEWRGVLRLADE